jgi:hypothetical protein
MGVAPAEGKLECVVKISHAPIGANQKPPPDQWTDAAQPGMKLVNLGSLHHALHAIKARCQLPAPDLPWSRAVGVRGMATSV